MNDGLKDLDSRMSYMYYKNVRVILHTRETAITHTTKHLDHQDQSWPRKNGLPIQTLTIILYLSHLPRTSASSLFTLHRGLTFAKWSACTVLYTVLHCFQVS